jgi:hypothetical protein
VTAKTCCLNDHWKDRREALTSGDQTKNPWCSIDRREYRTTHSPTCLKHGDLNAAWRTRVRSDPIERQLIRAAAAPRKDQSGAGSVPAQRTTEHGGPVPVVDERLLHSALEVDLTEPPIWRPRSEVDPWRSQAVVGTNFADGYVEVCSYGQDQHLPPPACHQLVRCQRCRQRPRTVAVESDLQSAEVRDGKERRSVHTQTSLRNDDK